MLTDKYITLSLLLQLLNFINETLGTIPVIYMSSTVVVLTGTTFVSTLQK